MHRTVLAVLLAGMLSQASACPAGNDSTGACATFVAENGSAIELNMQSMTVQSPHSKARALFDCGDTSHTCFTDRHGFAFAFAHACDNVGLGSGTMKRKLSPKIVSILHGNLWVVFDASPNYLFHYVIPKGVVGIYVGATPSYDFRSLFSNPNVQIGKLDAVEYRITAGSSAIAACSEK